MGKPAVGDGTIRAFCETVALLRERPGLAWSMGPLPGPDGRTFGVCDLDGCVAVNGGSGRQAHGLAFVEHLLRSEVELSRCADGSCYPVLFATEVEAGPHRLAYGELVGTGRMVAANGLWCPAALDAAVDAAVRREGRRRPSLHGGAVRPHPGAPQRGGAVGGPLRGRGGQRVQEHVPVQREPRHPHPHERHRGPGHAPPPRRRRPRPRARPHPQDPGLLPAHAGPAQRRPRHVQDRERQDHPQPLGVRALGAGRGRGYHREAPGPRQGSGLPGRRLRGPRRSRGGRQAPHQPGSHQHHHQCREVHPRGGAPSSSTSSRRRAPGPTSSPCASP